MFFVINVKTREILIGNVTANPTRQWLENVIRTSFCTMPDLPKVMVSDRDGIYGDWFKTFLKDYFEIKLIRIPPTKPIFNCYSERLVRTFREELTEAYPNSDAETSS